MWEEVTNFGRTFGWDKKKNLLLITQQVWDDGNPSLAIRRKERVVTPIHRICNWLLSSLVTITLFFYFVWLSSTPSAFCAASNPNDIMLRLWINKPLGPLQGSSKWGHCYVSVLFNNASNWFLYEKGMIWFNKVVFCMVCHPIGKIR